jgi:hypothetical protein
VGTIAHFFATIARIRLGEEGAADSLLAHLRSVADEPFSHGGPQARESTLLALLGRKDEAVAAMKRSFARGKGFEMSLHSDPLFENLWDYPPYREFIKPKK